MELEELARYAFILFVVLAFIMGLIVGYMRWNGDTNADSYNAYVMLVMLVLGVFIGLISITGKEIMPFLIATIALLVASNAAVWEPLREIHVLLFQWTTTILGYIVAFATPAAVINAVRAVFAMAREK